MTLIEKLNNIYLVGDSEGLTFFRSTDSEGATADDIDPDDARAAILEFISDAFWAGVTRCEIAKQLCIYGAALFDAIDNHDADPSDHDPKG